jgi:hypothetical protein
MKGNYEFFCKEAREVNLLSHFESIHFHTHAILFSFSIGVDMWATLDAQLLALIPSFQKLPLPIRRNLTPFSNNTTRTRSKMKFHGMIIMSANFMTPWTFGGTKQGLFSTMFQLLPMIRINIYNVKTWNKWKMDITLR